MREPAYAISPDSNSGHPAGCRCLPCRVNKSSYERKRVADVQKNGPGLVSAEEVMKHLKLLSRYKIGLRAVAAATDISILTLRSIRNGKKSVIRRKNAEKILAVDKNVISDHALVPASKTWRQINQMIEEGYTRQFIARNLGVNSGRLSINDAQVCAITASRVERLYKRCMF